MKKKVIILFLSGLLCFTLSAYCQDETMSPIPGAKIYFSDKPFTTNHEGSKTSFKSGDFIYGRLELDNTTLLEAFKMSSIKTRYYYLRFWITAFKDGEKSGNNNSWDFLLIKNEEDVKKNYLNFDILPDPAKASSAICGTEDFSSVLGSSPLSMIVNQTSFPEDGEYSIQTRLFLETVDVWGKQQAVEKWPVVIDQFQFTFSGSDIQTLKKNAEAADELVQKNTFRLNKLPDYFSNSNKLTDPLLSNANIAAVVKRDLASGNMALLKYSVGDFTGTLWQIEKNELGLILRRFVTPNINIAYKFQDDCYVGTVRLWQEYIGGGKYGQLIVGSRTCNSCGQKIDCEKVK